MLAGIGFAGIAPQTVVPAAFAVGFWVYCGPVWRDLPKGRRVARAIGVVLLAAGVYLGLARVAAPFSVNTTPDFAHFTMLADLEHLPSGLGQLAQHVLRSINGLLAVGALLGVAVLAARRARPPTIPPFEFWGSLLLAGSVALQPLIFSPQYAAHNETRLAVLALGPFVCSLAFALRALERLGSRLTWASAAAVLAVLAVGSLHHLYTVVGTSNASQTVALQFVAAACVAGLLWRSSRLAVPPSQRVVAPPQSG